MKRHAINTPWVRRAMACLALVCAASLGHAQTAQDYIINQFDDGTTGGWSPNYGQAPMTLEFDPAQDRGPGNSPGALKVTVNFDLCTLLGNNQRDWERSLGQALDLTKYTRFHFSAKVDPSSSHMSDWGAGGLGNLRPHIRLADWSGDKNLGSDNNGAQFVGANAYGQWQDYAYNIDQTLDNLATRQATVIFGLDMWSGWGTCAAPIGQTNTVIFWLDNMWFELNTNTAPPPPPTLGMVKSGPSGVQITMDDKTDQWQRNGITTPTGSNGMWTALGGYPVTYSCTVADFPDKTAHPGFEAHMYVANGSSITGQEGNGATDWNSSDIFIFRVENIANGARAQIQWKTNYPASNATNIPVVVTAPGVVGTWIVTFTDSTHGSLSGPGITATNFTLPDDAVANNFTPASSYVQFGMFKNDGANDGHNNNYHGTYSHVQVSGPNASIDDTFNGALLTNNYAWRATSPSAVQQIPPGTAWISDWTVPAAGFSTESAAAVTGPWVPVAYTRTYQSGGEFHGLIPQSAFPAGNAGFLRLIKRPFTKLQVLMPGETAAPNTPTGKTGTPTPQSAGFQFNIRVNACDAYWNVIPASDTVTITSSDTGASLPSDTALVNGTVSLPVTLPTTGTQTVTASDVTDNTKTANTGSPTSVTP